MNILITNDDGINAPGIYSLVKEFMNEGNVIVSAPDSQRSASSHSITVHGPISASRTDFHDLRCSAYAVSGTPVDCVKLAYDKLTDGSIDIVISGINEGGNLGIDVLYSGTVSAAFEGALLNIPSIAVSLVKGSEEYDYGKAAHYARVIYEKFMKQAFREGTILNINVPPCRRDDVKGIMATCLGERKYSNYYEERKDDGGKSFYYLSGDVIKTENGEATDIYAIENNYVSVTPMHFEFTRFDYIDRIKEWFKANE